MELKFRLLKADEIECRIASVSKDKKGVSVLLYKDARVDQNILDETVGPMNWQRHHLRDNANCIVSIWDDDKKQWIEKEDTGKESNTEKEKGLASDSFKRACFNWGIGRELYSAPFIWISKCKITDDLKCYDKFFVREIQYDENRNISSLVICNENSGEVVYRTEPKGNAKEEPKKNNDVKEEPRKAVTSSNAQRANLKATQRQIELLHQLVADGEPWAKMLKWAGVDKVEDMSAEKASEIITKKTAKKKEA